VVVELVGPQLSRELRAETFAGRAVVGIDRVQRRQEHARRQLVLAAMDVALEDVEVERHELR
jgi:hypothetical protein